MIQYKNQIHIIRSYFERDSYKNQQAVKFITMTHLFRLFIETQLFNSTQNTPILNQEITPNRLCHKLHKLMQKHLLKSTTVDKIGANIQKDKQFQMKQQGIERNQLYMNSLKQLSTFLFKLSYNHPGIILYPKYTIENVIGFYEISKQIYHSGLFTLHSKELRTVFNFQVINLLFTQKIMIYKDIYYRIQQSSVFKNFIEEFFMLIGGRIQMMLGCFGVKVCQKLVQTCKSHVRAFIERYQMVESMRPNMYKNHMLTSNSPIQMQNNYYQAINSNMMMMTHSITQNQYTSIHSEVQSQQMLNIISIDEIIICFVYLIYRSSRSYSKVAMHKLTQAYHREILKQKRYKKDNRLPELYNNCYLKLFLAGKLEKIDKNHVLFEQSKLHLFLAQIVQNQQTILDNFVSSLEN